MSEQACPGVISVANGFIGVLGNSEEQQYRGIEWYAEVRGTTGGVELCRLV